MEIFRKREKEWSVGVGEWKGLGWEEHFIREMEGSQDAGGSTEEMNGGDGRRGGQITEGEFEWAWGRLKLGRAKGLDGIENEAFMYGGEGVKCL